MEYADEGELVCLKYTRRTKQTIISSIRPRPEFLPVDARRMNKRLDTGGGERKKLSKRKLFSISRDYMDESAESEEEDETRSPRHPYPKVSDLAQRIAL